MQPPCSFHPCDEAVIATNDDASDCKRCAVRLGYWKDDYIGYFVRNQERKAPEINRGYFARVKGVETCIEKFLKKTNGNCQIINLGCGFDTLYFRLRDTSHQVKNFIELDFPTVTARKCYTIKRNKALLAKIHDEDGEVRLSPTDLHGPNYHLMGVDLRNIDEVGNKLQQAEIDYTLPTIFLAECVLVYIEVQNCKNLLKWIASKFKITVFVNYEQVNMNDRFGEVMLNNLRSRGCSLAGVESCISLETQTKRFLECGWTGARAWDMIQVYQSISPSERHRIEHIEMLDEGELLIQLFQHYCLVVAWIGELFQDIEITCSLSNAPAASTLNFPPPKSLPGMDDEIPFVIVADYTFPLKPYLMKPYSYRQQVMSHTIFNYRLSRVRRIIENVFGICAARFRILRRPIDAEPEKS